MNKDNNNSENLVNAGIAAIAASSKTPFKTAFLITLGMGLGHLVLFFGAIATIIGIILWIK